jgi:N-acetylmuramoyl-L-alanine amidase
LQAFALFPLEVASQHPALGESPTTRPIVRIQPWTSSCARAAFPLLLLITTVGAGIFSSNLLLSGASPEEKRVSIFSTVASYSLPVVQVGDRQYIGLLEVLEPLGKVSAKADQKHWKLRYNNTELEFNFDKTRVRMKEGDFDLGAPFAMQNGRGLVPISDLGPLLSRVLGGPVTFSPASRRVFIGNIAVHFTAQVSDTAPPSLVMNFSAPVNPTIATDAGKLQMTFAHEPIVPSGTQTLTFNNSVITSATYQDGNGNATITVAGNAPLFANFSNGRKTITIAVPSANPQAAESPVHPAPPAAVPPVTPAPSAPPTYFAVVDASHGGEDRGASLNGNLLEKDITLAFARRLQQEIEARGLPTLLLRNGDADISLDQRAGTTNAAHPSIYICIHATSQGNGVSFFTALVPAGNQDHGPFLDWDTAQASSLAKSRAAMAILASSFENSKIPARQLAAPLRPLNNLTIAAIAIEIGPSGGSSLDSSDYQQLMASTIANGIAAVHQQLGSAP